MVDILKTKTEALFFRLERTVEGATLYARSALVERFARGVSSSTNSPGDGFAYHRLDRLTLDRDREYPAIFNAQTGYYYMKIFLRAGLSEGVTLTFPQPLSADRINEIREHIRESMHAFVSQYGKAVRVTCTMTVDDSALRLDGDV